jgi:hypothetical protein
MNKVKNLKVRLAALILAASSTFALYGCQARELAPEEEYDIVIQGDDDSQFNGLTQTLDVPGQDFKLVTEYSCDNASKREWRITSDKFLYYSVKTSGLSENTEVYIDNVHIDTSIKSKYAAMDGIRQDSMDDRVHSSQLIGFPVSDTTIYYGVNAIEGCNQDFIKGTFYGYNGYSSGEVEEKRYTEGDYIDLGVYANKIQIVYDLLIKGPNDKDFSNVSVATDFIVPITTSEIKYENDSVEAEKETEPQKTK